MAETPEKPDVSKPSKASSALNGAPGLCGLPSFADQLFLGHFAVEELMPYFEQPENAAAAGDSMVAKTKKYCQEFVFADRIDQHALLPPGIIKGMGNIGVTGMTTKKELGGNAMSTFNFCRVLEILGGHCGSTAALVRLQSCIILNLLQMYATPEQQGKWMPAIAAGDVTGALLITEELAGSDLNNIRTNADPQDSAKGYRINGEKRWVANGGNADLLIVLARTPDDSRPAGRVSAFLVPATANGVSVNTYTEHKLGLKGVSIGTLTLDNVSVSNDDLLGSFGKAIAMVESVKVLDRIAMAATAVGSLKFLLQTMVAHATTRTQFGEPIGQFHQVKEKIAQVAADLYALESAVYHTASQYDCDKTSVTRESQMLKLFASESLWSAINGTMDVLGGNSVFKDQPWERVLRNVRHSLTADGSNDLLKQQIAGQRTGGGYSADQGAENAKTNWWSAASKILPTSPTIEVKHDHLRFHSRWLANHIGKFGWYCRSSYVADAANGLQAGRVATLATNLFMSSCVFAKLSALMVNGTIPDPQKQFAFDAGALFLHQAKAHNLDLLDQLKVNLDDEKLSVADHWLSHKFDNADWPITPSDSAGKQEA